MEVPAITDHATHALLLRVCEALCQLDPPPESVHGDYLLALATAIETYERIHFPIHLTRRVQR